MAHNLQKVRLWKMFTSPEGSGVYWMRKLQELVCFHAYLQISRTSQFTKENYQKYKGNFHFFCFSFFGKKQTCCPRCHLFSTLINWLWQRNVHLVQREWLFTWRQINWCNMMLIWSSECGWSHGGRLKDYGNMMFIWSSECGWAHGGRLKDYGNMMFIWSSELYHP